MKKITFEKLYWLLAINFCLAVLIVDAHTPAIYPIAVFYTLPIFMIAFLISSRRHVITITLICICFTMGPSLFADDLHDKASTCLLAGVIGGLGYFFFTFGRVYRETEERKFKLESFVKDLKQSNQDLEEFAFIASHDLRSPLRAIDNLVNWIEEDSDLDGEPLDHLHKVKQRVQRMDNLLEDLLQYSRVGRKRYKVETFSLEELVKEIWESLEAPEEAVLELRGQLPAIHSERAPLDLVFRNLFGNSIKHRNRDDITVSVRCLEKESEYLFEVKDNGKGIPRDLHEKAFKMFQTLQPRDQTEGSGMGLAIIKKTIQRYGGDLNLNSDVGQGVEFRFTWMKITTKDEGVSHEHKTGNNASRR